MKISALTQYAYLPVIIKINVLEMIKEGCPPAGIYLIIGFNDNEEMLLTIPIQMLGKKSDTSLALNIIRKFLLEQGMEKESKRVCYWLNSDSQCIPPRKIFHQEFICDINLHAKIWLHNLFPLELLPKLAKAFDIANSGN